MKPQHNITHINLNSSQVIKLFHSLNIMLQDNNLQDFGLNDVVT